MEPTIKLLNINTPVELIKSGRLIGQKCITIRFRGCNLRCAWTTPDFKGNVCKYCSTAEPGIELSIIDIMTIIKETGVKNVIISGGEAILQHDSLVELLKLLKKHKLYVIFETNATIFHYDICDKIDYLVLSPKLSTTIPTEISLRNTNIEYNENFELKHAQLRRNVKVFQAYIDSFRYKPNDYEIRVAISHSSDIF
jgi:7-carboxy-7-deazaguanine synthase